MLKRIAILTAAIAVLVAICAAPAIACWAAPPPVAWSKSADGKFEIERRNKEATIVVHPVGKREVTLYSAKIADFNSLFSKIHVVDNGTVIIHVRGNHMVRKLEQPAVAVYRKDSKTKTIITNQIVKGLAIPDPRKPRISTSPSTSWLKKVNSITDKALTLTNIDDEQKVIDLKTGKVTDAPKKAPAKG
jgi:hypothetical protein